MLKCLTIDLSEVEKYTARNAPKVLVEIINNHSGGLDGFIAFCDEYNIPNLRVGYEYVYRNDLIKYRQIQKSKDMKRRLRPDVLIYLHDKFMLVDPKHEKGFLPALALKLNAERDEEMFYILGREHVVFARDILKDQTKYLKCMIIFNKKDEDEETREMLKKTFSQIELHYSDLDIGAYKRKDGSMGYRSGDTCVILRDDAPLLLLVDVCR